MSVQTYTSSDSVFSMKMADISTANFQAVINKALEVCTFSQPVQTSPGSETHVMIYVEGVRKVYREFPNLPTFLDAMEGHISAIMFFTVFSGGEGIVELFVGSCGYDAHYIKEMINVIVHEYSGFNYVWACIVPDTPIFYEIVSFLVENNFENPKLGDETFMKEKLEQDVISLLLDRQDSISKPDEIDVALELQRKYSGKTFPDRISCKFFIQIPQTVLRELKKFLDEPMEYGGLLVISSYKLVVYNGHLVPIAILGFPAASKTLGEKYSVMHPFGYFNFHVHPRAIYKERPGAISNPPSDADVAFLAYAHSLNLIMHFLISQEGLYAIQLTPEFTHYMNQIYEQNFADQNECIFGLLNSVKKIMKSDEVVRAANYEVAEYTVRVINNITIRDILRNVESKKCDWLEPDYNFLLYRCIFHRWETLESERDGFTVLSDKVLYKGQTCTPSIGVDAPKIDDEEFVV